MTMHSPSPVFLMEDHCDAYPEWRGLGAHDLPCVHLDAHLDLSDEAFPRAVLEALAAARTADEVRAYRTHPRLPWGGYHAGNYLYPAMHDGTVSHLYWVIPPWLPRRAHLLDWARRELQGWVQMTLDDYASLHTVGDRVEGRVLGRPFTLCTLEALPAFDGRVLLDVDVDYFLDHDDTLFAPVDEIVERVRSRLGVPIATTIAYSVNGGYTPLEHRYVGDLLVALAAQAKAGDAEAGRTMRRGDRLRIEGRFDDAIDAYTAAAEHGALFTAAARYKTALAHAAAGHADEARRAFAEAAGCDPHYRARAVDVAFLWFRRRDYANTLEWLQRARVESPEETPLTLYIEGHAHLRERALSRGVEAFEQLLADPSLRPADRAHISSVLSRARLRDGRAAAAVEAAREAVEHDPENGLYHLRLADGLRAASLVDEAARHYRKAISLCGHTVGSLDAHESLIALYEASGQHLLASSETRRLVKKDVVGTFAARAMLGRGRSTP